uniref:Uncharacterized protein n=1 Tax=Glossina austeni TaxID=7395 RepID=A0A1A9VMB4_GLOAU
MQSTVSNNTNKSSGDTQALWLCKAKTHAKDRKQLKTFSVFGLRTLSAVFEFDENSIDKLRVTWHDDCNVSKSRGSPHHSRGVVMHAYATLTPSLYVPVEPRFLYRALHPIKYELNARYEIAVGVVLAVAVVVVVVVVVEHVMNGKAKD